MTLSQILLKAIEFDDNEMGPYTHHRFITILRSMISRGEAADICMEILRAESARLRENIEKILPVIEAVEELKRMHDRMDVPEGAVSRDAYVRKRARNAKVTHCPRGHEYSGENLVVRRGKRYCQSCKAIANKSRSLKK